MEETEDSVDIIHIDENKRNVVFDDDGGGCSTQQNDLTVRPRLRRKLTDIKNMFAVSTPKRQRKSTKRKIQENTENNNDNNKENEPPPPPLQPNQPNSTKSNKINKRTKKDQNNTTTTTTTTTNANTATTNKNIDLSKYHPLEIDIAQFLCDLGNNKFPHFSKQIAETYNQNVNKKLVASSNVIDSTLVNFISSDNVTTNDNNSVQLQTNDLMKVEQNHHHHHDHQDSQVLNTFDDITTNIIHFNENLLNISIRLDKNQYADGTSSGMVGGGINECTSLFNIHFDTNEFDTTKENCLNSINLSKSHLNNNNNNNNKECSSFLTSDKNSSSNLIIEETSIEENHQQFRPYLTGIDQPIQQFDQYQHQHQQPHPKEQSTNVTNYENLKSPNINLIVPPAPQQQASAPAPTVTPGLMMTCESDETHDLFNLSPPNPISNQQNQFKLEEFKTNNFNLTNSNSSQLATNKLNSYDPFILITDENNNYSESLNLNDILNSWDDETNRNINLYASSSTPCKSELKQEKIKLNVGYDLIDDDLGLNVCRAANLVDLNHNNNNDQFASPLQLVNTSDVVADTTPHLLLNNTNNNTNQNMSKSFSKKELNLKQKLAQNDKEVLDFNDFEVLPERKNKIIKQLKNEIYDDTKSSSSRGGDKDKYPEKEEVDFAYGMACKLFTDDELRNGIFVADNCKNRSKVRQALDTQRVQTLKDEIAKKFGFDEDKLELAWSFIRVELNKKLNRFKSNKKKSGVAFNF